MFQSLTHLLPNNKRATAVEYSIMVVAIATVIIATGFVIGGQVDSAFDFVSNHMAVVDQ